MEKYNISESELEHENITFSGKVDTDILILLQLPYIDIINTCNTSKYANLLCKNDFLWHKLIIRDFGINLIGYISKDDSFKQAYMNIYNSSSLYDIAFLAVQKEYIPLIDKLITSEDEIIIPSEDYNLMEKMEKKDNLTIILGFIAFIGNFKLLKQIIDYYKWKKSKDTLCCLLYINIKFNTDYDIIKYLVKYSTLNCLKFDILETVLKKEDPNLLKFLFKIDKKNALSISTNSIISTILLNNKQITDIILDRLLLELEYFNKTMVEYVDVDVILSIAIINKKYYFIEQLFEILQYDDNIVQLHHLNQAQKQNSSKIFNILKYHYY